MRKFLENIGYQGEILEYVTQKICGIWFLWIGILMFICMVFSNGMCMNPYLFAGGYAIGFYLLYGKRTILFDRLAEGKQSAFQKKSSDRALIVLIILCSFIGLFNWLTEQGMREIWFSILFAVGFHFILFYFVHGKTVVILGLVCCVISIVGLMNPNLPFSVLGGLDALAKIIGGCYLLVSKKGNNKTAFYRKYYSV